MANYLLVFVVCALAGWLLDTAYRSLMKNAYAPKTYIPHVSVIYGLGGIMLLSIYENVQGTALEQILAGGIAITLLELSCGLFCEHILGEKLWDYSKNKANLYGHIDALHTLYWFALAALVRLVVPYLN